jgi:cytochrome P450
MLQYGLDPEGFFGRARQRFGDAFTVRLMGDRWVVLAADDAVREVFSTPADMLDAGAANWPLRPFIGTRNVFFLDGSEHLHRRKIVLSPLHGEAMRKHARLISEITDRELDSWPLGRPVPALPRLRQITFDVMMNAMFGRAQQGRMEQLRDRIWRLVSWAVDKRRAAVYAFLGAQWLMRLPAYRRQLHAIDTELEIEIERRRATPIEADHSDVLTELLRARDEHGAPLLNTEIRDDVMALVLAGHETTTGMLAWAVHELARAPIHQQRIAAGEDGVLNAVIKETLRLRSPASVASLRRLREPLTLGGIALPAGTTVALTPVLFHRRPDIYPAPDTFNPDRFLATRPSNTSWLPFGGGVRRCLGSAFAEFQAAIVLERLATRFVLTPDRPKPERIDRHGFVAVPARGARTIATPRTATRAPATDSKSRR